MSGHIVDYISDFGDRLKTVDTNTKEVLNVGSEIPGIIVNIKGIETWVCLDQMEVDLP